MADTGKDIVKDKFGFLCDEYSFKLKRHRKDRWSYDFLYLSDKCGVHIVMDFRESYLFVSLHKLQNGILIDDPRFIDEKTVLTGFSLDTILLLRAPEALMKPGYTYGKDSIFFDKERGLGLYVSAFADNLKKYGADVLSGDFTIFETLEPIVKRRAIHGQ